MPIILQVVGKFVKELEKQLATRHVTIEVSTAAQEWFASKGFDTVFGARPMARLIQRELKNRLADEILFGSLKDGGVVNVDCSAGELTFDIKPRKAGED
jgi:ATP-dependent Clp protease ATP-binding subunit ClpA